MPPHFLLKPFTNISLTTARQGMDRDSISSPRKPISCTSTTRCLVDSSRPRRPGSIAWRDTASFPDPAHAALPERALPRSCDGRPHPSAYLTRLTSTPAFWADDALSKTSTTPAAPHASASRGASTVALGRPPDQFVFDHLPAHLFKRLTHSLGHP